MRVISGSRRGKKLISPLGLETRPTEDRVKESLFNILYKIDEDSTVLDCFAGSGAIGIEFLSRGASCCYFIDRSRDSIRTINENLKITKFEDRAKVLNSNIEDFLRVYSNLKFDYIYIDPPYEQVELIYDTMNKISEANILKEEGIIIVEHLTKVEVNSTVGKLAQYKKKKYGKKTLSFYN